MFLTNATHGFGFTESCTYAPALLYPLPLLSALVHYAKLNQIHILLVTPLDDVWNFIMLHGKHALLFYFILFYFILFCCACSSSLFSYFPHCQCYVTRNFTKVPEL